MFTDLTTLHLEAGRTLRVKEWLWMCKRLSALVPVLLVKPHASSSFTCRATQECFEVPK